MFRKGQKLVYVDNSGEWDWSDGTDTEPRKGEIVTCGGACFIYPGYIYIQEYLYSLSGVIQAFRADRFRPLLGNSAMTELINKVQVIETSDCPINIPEYESTN